MAADAIRLVRRKRSLHAKTIASLAEMVDEAKSGEVTAVAAIAVRPGSSVWIVRSNMTSRDRMNVIAQIEYLKWLLLQDEDSALQ